MKKVLSLMLALVMSLSVIACGGGNEKAEEQAAETAASTTAGPTVPEETLPPEPSVPVFYDPALTTGEELDKMLVEQGNRHNMNTFNYDNSWIYGGWAGRSNKGEVVKVRYDNTDWTVIDDNTNGNYAPCQAVKDGYLYYSQISPEGTELIKVRTSGEDAKVIIADHSGSIQIVDDFIYYTTAEIYTEDYSAVTEESTHLYRCDLNGENQEAILETPVYYFTVFGDYVLYQADKDGMTLHIYEMSSGKDVRINEHRSFWPVYDGAYIYYLTDSNSPENYQHKLWRVSLDGEINEEIDVGCHMSGLLVRGDYIYYINEDDGARIYRCYKDGSGIELVSQDSNVGKFQWINKGLAYTVMNSKGQIYAFFFCNSDGSNRTLFDKPKS